MRAGAPEISFVLLTDTYATIRNVLSHLRRQSARDRLELVIVTPSREELELEDGVCSGLHSVQIVESELESIPRARATGIQAARAPIVVLGETHCYPEPEYAEALIEAHRGPWAVVGPAMLNANPESLLSWAGIFLDYGPWVECKERGPMADVPSHNGSYKRSVLLEYGPRLEEMLESDTVLNADLLSKGNALYLESRARTSHLNVSQFDVWIAERLLAGRAFAASRARIWPRGRRLWPWRRRKRRFRCSIPCPWRIARRWPSTDWACACSARACSCSARAFAWSARARSCSARVSACSWRS